MPEIDVPAHARSIVRVRPELGLNNGDSDRLDLSRPGTGEFVRALFDEFTPWFRGPFVLFGADEYEKDHADLYLDFFNEISSHLVALGKKPMAWGSLGAMSGGADAAGRSGYSRNVVICSGNNDWYGPQAATADGYRIINTNDELLYIVPFTGNYHGKHLDGRALFDSWEPHVFGKSQSLDPQHPQLLGAASAVWNDMVLQDYDEQLIHRLVEPTFGLLAQKMWSGAPAGLSYEAFMLRIAALRQWPGRSHLQQP